MWLFMKLFETKIDNNIHKDYKAKEIAGGVFHDNYIEYKIKGDEQLIIEQYLEKIRSNLHDRIDGFKKFGKWKIHLAIKINFLSTTSCTEKSPMHFESDSIEIMTAFDTQKKQ